MSTPRQPVLDAESKNFWEGLEVGEIRLPRCTRCLQFHYYPRQMCPHCGSVALEWQTVDPVGSIYSVTRIPRRDGTEQVIALIDLDVGPRMMSERLGADPVAIGDRVRIAPSGEPALPTFVGERDA